MKIVLKTLKKSEFPQIVEWINAHDEDFIVQWAGNTYQFPLTVEQMEKHYSRGINSLDSDVFIYKIILEDTEEVIGTVQLCKFDSNNKEAVMGRFLLKDERYRGQGIGKAVVHKLVSLGFEEFQLDRIRLNVYDINERAIRCYESVGFRRMGLSEKVYKSAKGDYWGNIEMVLNKNSWKKFG